MLVSFVYVLACRLFVLLLLLARSDRSKELELLVLRHELSILPRQARRPQLMERDRLVLAALSRVMPRRSWQAFPVTPETLLRWHRRIVARRRTYLHRPPGRPPVDREVRQLILRLARENSHWGYVRIAGELRKLGITVSATLVRKVLARAGILPAPERTASNWRSFLRQHQNSILACDLFTVDTVWLRRLHVLFFVSIGSRRVEYVACTPSPDTAWMTQQARNLLMDLDDRSERPRILIHDRDTKFSRAFDVIFRAESIEIVHADPGAERERPRRTLDRQRTQGVPRPRRVHLFRSSLQIDRIPYAAKFLHPRGQQATRQTSPDHAYFVQVRERTEHKSASLWVARKFCRRAYHILRKLGEQALAPVEVDAPFEEAIRAAA